MPAGGTEIVLMVSMSIVLRLLALINVVGSIRGRAGAGGENESSQTLDRARGVELFIHSFIQGDSQREGEEANSVNFPSALSLQILPL